MDPTEDVSARVLLKRILIAEPPRTPVTRSESKVRESDAVQLQPQTNRRSKVIGASPKTPKDMLRRSLRANIYKNISRSPLPVVNKTAVRASQRVKTPASVADTFNDEDTMRGIIRNILHTEPVKSPAEHEKSYERPVQSIQKTTRRSSTELTVLDLPDLTLGNSLNTNKGLSRKRKRRTLNVTAFEKQLKAGEVVEEHEQSSDDPSSLSLSSTSLTLKTPFAQVHTEKIGMQRRALNRHKITEEEFGEAVNRRLQAGPASVTWTNTASSETSFCRDFDLALSYQSDMEVTNDLINSNINLYPPDDHAVNASQSIMVTQEQPTVPAHMDDQNSKHDCPTTDMIIQEHLDELEEDVGDRASERRDGLRVSQKNKSRSEEDVDEKSEEEIDVRSQSEEVHEKSQSEEEVEETSQSEEVHEKSQSEEEVEETSQSEEVHEKSQSEEEVEETSQSEEVHEKSQSEEEVEATSQSEEVHEKSQSEEEVEETSQSEEVHEKSQSEEEVEETSQSEDVHEKSQSEQEVDEKSQSEEEVDEKSQSEEEVEETSQSEEVHEKSQSEEEVEATSLSEEVHEKSQSEQEVDEKSQSEEEVDEKSQSEEEVDQKSQSEEEVDQKSQPEEEGVQFEDEEMNDFGLADENGSTASSPTEDESNRVLEANESEEIMEHLSCRSRVSDGGLLIPLTPAVEDQDAAEEEEEDDGEDELAGQEEWGDESDDEDTPMKTPAFVRQKRIFDFPKPAPLSDNGQVDPSSSATKSSSPPKPKPRVRRKNPAAPKKQTGLPRSYLMGTFKHFAKTRVSADVYPVLSEIIDKYFDRLAEDMETYATHAGRKNIEVEDVVLLLKRQGHVSDKVPVEVLIEKYLRMEQRKLLIPIATSGNVVFPKKRW